MKGIDVYLTYQGYPDWKKVKAYGELTFAIIKRLVRVVQSPPTLIYSKIVNLSIT